MSLGMNARAALMMTMVTRMMVTPLDTTARTATCRRGFVTGPLRRARLRARPLVVLRLLLVVAGVPAGSHATVR